MFCVFVSLVDFHIIGPTKPLVHYFGSTSKLLLPKNLDQMSWLGRGPYGTYTDRKFARISAYSGSLDEQ